MKKTFILILFFVSFGVSYAQEEIRVLWLGNSYTAYNSLPTIVNELSTGTDKTVKSKSICPGGYTLFQHAENSTSLDAIREGCWDYVVLQEQSQLPSIDYYRHNTMRPAYQALYDSIMMYNSDAIVVGYMTWGRRYGGKQCVDFGDGLHCSADFVDFNHMQDTMSAAYCENAYATDSYVSPVGDAWKEALSRDNRLVLHSTDDSHPTYEGSYLAACVFHAVFWQESPVGTYFNTSSISPKRAEFLQNVAHDVFFNDLEKWNIEIDVTGIDRSCEDNDDFKVINSPNSDNISIKNKNGKSANVKIININGAIIADKDIHGDATLHIGNSQGIYIVHITEQGSQARFVQKIVR